MDRVALLLDRVASGDVSPEHARSALGDRMVEGLGFATVDHFRTHLQGYPEVVFGQGKTPEQIVGICESLVRATGGFLVTRTAPPVRQLLAERFPGVVVNELGRTVLLAADGEKREQRGPVLVVTAGTADLPVAEEAAVVAEAMGNRVERLTDVGVAGIHRVLHKADVLRQAAVVIVVAGMDGALPSVIGGMLSRPVIAVPTSVGYGASFGGVAALLAMLNSCAAGVTVVNIDSGFAAAAAASRITRLAPGEPS